MAKVQTNCPPGFSVVLVRQALAPSLRASFQSIKLFEPMTRDLFDERNKNPIIMIAKSMPISNLPPGFEKGVLSKAPEGMFFLIFTRNLCRISLQTLSSKVKLCRMHVLNRGKTQRDTLPCCTQMS